jgi:hypothetical protein
MEHDSAREAFERHWTALSEEVLSGMDAWRAQHPQATLTEIELEVDARLAQLRARLVERVAQQSAAATWPRSQAGPHVAPLRTPRAAPAAVTNAPTCSQCGTRLEPRGRRRRRLRTTGGQQLALERDYGVCPHCGQGLFPPG